MERRVAEHQPPDQLSSSAPNAAGRSLAPQLSVRIVVRLTESPEPRPHRLRVANAGRARVARAPRPL